MPGVTPFATASATNYLCHPLPLSADVSLRLKTVITLPLSLSVISSPFDDCRKAAMRTAYTVRPTLSTYRFVTFGIIYQALDVDHPSFPVSLFASLFYHAITSLIPILSHDVLLSGIQRLHFSNPNMAWWYKSGYPHAIEPMISANEDDLCRESCKLHDSKYENQYATKLITDRTTHWLRRYAAQRSCLKHPIDQYPNQYVYP